MASLSSDRAQQYRAAQGEYLMILDRHRMSQRYGLSPTVPEWFEPFLHEHQLFNRLFSLFKTTVHKSFRTFFEYLTEQQFISYLRDHPFQRDFVPVQSSISVRVLQSALVSHSEQCVEESVEVLEPSFEPIVEISGISIITVETVRDIYEFSKVDVINIDGTLSPINIEASGTILKDHLGDKRLDSMSDESFEHLKVLICNTENKIYKSIKMTHEDRVLSVFSIYGCRLLMYAPPHTGKSTFMFEHNMRICRSCAVDWRDYKNFSVYQRHPDFIADTDEIESWGSVPHYVVTNVALLLRSVESSLSIIPSYDVFVNRCICRGLIPKYQWYAELIECTKLSGIQIKSNKYMSDLCFRIVDMLRLQI